MPDAEFLEKYPLYKKFKCQIPGDLSQIPKPAIHMYCQMCGSEQTFNMSNQYHDSAVHKDRASKGKTVRAEYTCAACRKFNRTFLLKFDADLEYVLKAGQWPSWKISIEKNLSKALGPHEDHYQKGLTCESQGYGIGAYAYFRRIIEEIIDELLDMIYDMIEEPEKGKYKAALAQTKQTKVTDDKIRLVKDLLPSSLRPNNMNPLGILHDALSEGLHGKTDEECLEIAGHIKEVLIFLVTRIIQSKEASRRFTEGMRKILDKRTQSQSA